MSHQFNVPNPSVWLSRDAIRLSSQLIESLQISQGTTLARYLGVNPIFYNDEAVRVWVQRELETGLSIDARTLSQLEERFLSLVSLKLVSINV